jgi:hypothetical protein
VERDEPVSRVATLDDEAALDVLMKESAAALFPLFYDEQQAPIDKPIERPMGTDR